MTERAQVFREIAEALIAAHDEGIEGSCHGCGNVGDDALAWLKEKFPDDLAYVEVAGSYRVECSIKEQT